MQRRADEQRIIAFEWARYRCAGVRSSGAGRRRLFVDEQERGRYALWRHEHILSAEGARTRMVDRVIYAVPFGAFGRLANVLFVQSTLRSIFAYRVEAIQRLFG